MASGGTISSFRGGRPPARGRSVAARPPARGDRLQPMPPCKGAVGCGQGQPTRGRRPPAAKPQGQPPKGGRLQRGARKGQQSPVATSQGLLPMVCRRPPAVSPQGAADYRFDARRKAACKQRHRSEGLPPARATASNSSACTSDAHGGADCRGGRLLVEWLSAGKGSRRLHRGSSGGDDAVRVKEG
ncbi:hypothetical protein BHE74_00045488 [Ensete ventricosum]|nr:hypothetical protein BHE74_00045488 [Ensete ventricosum]